MKKADAVFLSMLLIIFLFNCRKFEHSNPVDPEYQGNGNSSILTQLVITPSTTNIYTGEKQQFVCTAYYSNLASIDVTMIADWSTTQNVGQMYDNGLYIAHNSNTGMDSIIATYQGYLAVTTINVMLKQNGTGTMRDVDGNVYKTVKIGNQWWMAENLKVSHYRDGSAIAQINENSGANASCYCAYNDNENHVDIYGYLYNWFALDDDREVAPVGWHVATDGEWQTLIDYLGGDDLAGGKLKEVGSSHWDDPNEGATNASKFTALPGGFYIYYEGTTAIGGLGSNAAFWSSSDYNDESAWFLSLSSESSSIERSSTVKNCCFSVRCVLGENDSNSLSYIIITPESVVLENSEKQKFGCTAYYSDGTSKSITTDVSWTITPGYAGTINESGEFTADETHTGTEIVTANYGRFSVQATVSVESSTHETGTVTDIDGNVYQTVKIGDQWWMAENLKVTHYRNGDVIPNVMAISTGTDVSTGSYCAYDNNKSNVNTYGYLYNWYAVDDNRNICPVGWHVPTDEEWKELEMHLGINQSETDNADWRGTDEGGKLKETGVTHWTSPNIGATNEVGFSALPGGYQNPSGYFYDIGLLAHFWSSSEHDGFSAWYRSLYYSHSDIYRSRYNKSFWFSVRCILGDDIESVTLSRITISPESITINNGDVIQFSCIAYYSDNSTETVTTKTNWSVISGNVGSINEVGQYTAHATNTGTETIVASYMGFSAQTNITVQVSNLVTGTLTDIDGNVYKTVKIGNQWWMAENLKATHYRNGVAIPNITSSTEWESLSTGAYCAYSNNESYADIYGYLYNWYAVASSYQIAPSGWHVPTDEDWKILEQYLGMSGTEANDTGWRGTDEGGKLKEAGSAHWYGSNNGATNEVGFCALPGGYRSNYGGYFNSRTYSAYFWSSTEVFDNSAWRRDLYYNYSYMNRNYYYKWNGFSIRLVKD